MAETTALECLSRFCTAIIAVFGEEYLRSPNKDDLKRILEFNEARGFPGMLGSLDCMHWEWKNCPAVWHELYAIGEGKRPYVSYMVNGNHYDMGYYLTDGIHLTYAAFVKSLNDPQIAKKKNFAAAQESVRKDVKRAFGVLQARFSIVAGPARMWRIDALNNIMTKCIILHNMIIESEHSEAEVHWCSFLAIDRQ